MASTIQRLFSDENLIGDPNDLDNLIESNARDLYDSELSGDEGPRQEHSDEEGEERQEAEEAEEEGEKKDEEDKDKEPVAPKKKVVRNPQLKLNADRIKCPRGLLALKALFEDFKFKGKGREKEDLECVLAKMEYWAHRLFPKFHFEDFIEKVERLGSKKEVQVYLKRLRMGLETGSDDGIVRDFEDDEEERARTTENEPMNEFDRLLGEQISFLEENQRGSHHTPKTPATLPPSPAFAPLTVSTLTEEQKQLIARKKREAQARRAARLKELEEQELQEALRQSAAPVVDLDPQPSTSGVIAASPKPPSSTEITAEQRARMERNKQLALERRRALMQGKLSSNQQLQPPVAPLSPSRPSSALSEPLAAPLTPRSPSSELSQPLAAPPTPSGSGTELPEPLAAPLTPSGSSIELLEPLAAPLTPSGSSTELPEPLAAPLTPKGSSTERAEPLAAPLSPNGPGSELSQPLAAPLSPGGPTTQLSQPLALSMSPNGSSTNTHGQKRKHLQEDTPSKAGELKTPSSDERITVDAERMDLDENEAKENASSVEEERMDTSEPLAFVSDNNYPQRNAPRITTPSSKEKVVSQNQNDCQDSCDFQLHLTEIAASERP